MKSTHILGALLLAAVGWLLWSQARTQANVTATQGLAPQTLATQAIQNQSTPQDEFSKSLAIVGQFFNGVMLGINTVANSMSNHKS